MANQTSGSVQSVIFHTNEILNDAMNSGKIISFNPALPSMNEIFIRVVESRN